MIQYVHDFLTKPEIFFERLIDYGDFQKDEFNRYTKTIYELNKVDLSESEKYKSAITVWDINLYIQKHLMFHIDPNDYAVIDNLNSDEISQITNILYYTANSFSYGNEIDIDYIMISPLN